MRPQLGQFAFLIFRKAAEKFLADHEREHGIAQELHLLVVGFQRRQRRSAAFCDSASRA